MGLRPPGYERRNLPEVSHCELGTDAWVSKVGRTWELPRRWKPELKCLREGEGTGNQYSISWGRRLQKSRLLGPRETRTAIRLLGP